jgi:hypothetical protein
VTPAVHVEVPINSLLSRSCHSSVKSKFAHLVHVSITRNMTFEEEPPYEPLALEASDKAPLVRRPATVSILKNYGSLAGGVPRPHVTLSWSNLNVFLKKVFVVN